MANASSRRIHGIDFSGAQDAGESIWITSGEINGDRLEIEKCRSAADEFDARDRKIVLEELREFVTDRNQSVFGFDFPFGLPETVTDVTDWNEFVETFSDDFDGPDHLRETCIGRADGQKSRATEVKTTALCPYGVRIKYQTFYGIHDLLNPLLSDSEVSVLPMMERKSDQPWLIEIYPAATLDQFGLCYRNYKDDSEASRKRRGRNLDGVLNDGNAKLGDEGIREVVVTDSDGDALDSIVAAVATFRAVPDGPPAFDESSHPEGHIFA